MAALKKARPSIEPAQSDVDLAQLAHAPLGRHAVLSGMLGARMFSESERPTVPASVTAMVKDMHAVSAGDMSTVSDILVGQTATLDALFGELVRRSCAHMGENMDATERYMRLALKAQSNARANIEALSKMHQQQHVQHVHVNNGGQAVVAEQFHHHAEDKNAEQPQAITRFENACSTTLRGEGEDTRRRAVPVTCDKR